MSYSSIEGLRHSVDNCQNRDALSSSKKIDLYEVAQIDFPIETIMNNLITLRNECKSAVEVKLSAWEYGEEQKDLIAVNTQLGIAGLAHSPLGQKLLTVTITKSFADGLPEGDYRARSNCFEEGYQIWPLPEN
ncbi:hypothetical protein F5050DRAFT_1712813 [Lentinula boryana]|uniref:Uncharacterized protein n=1 Tax=Lentinula boryana TaxID=40481 RepID=A0ABQ8QAS8_9AGAR|nr:hypothetical protein F5050DRAFT_1712813 [Lentinula boryana]